MPLTWNEIRQRAIAFSRSWADASRERADAQTFWNEFFHVFGKSRRAVASFEEPIRNLKGNHGFIDLFWKGRLIGESKSRGESLDKAHTQAIDYIQDLQRDGRDDELPRHVLVTDFARVAVHDLDPGDPRDLFDQDADATIEFDLIDLHLHVRRFAFIAGYEPQRLDPEDPANHQAAELLANLHDRLEDGGYAGHDLERFMVRVLFCLFAEDTGIFEPLQFENLIRLHTADDGNDVGTQLAQLFSTLNTDRPNRQRNLADHFAAFPYVNGRLFAERLDFASFTAPMRTALLACCRFRWETISPVIFGSLFQSVMDDRQRRRIGAHYTSERDILKLARSLFLDDLHARLDRCTGRRDYDAFIERLSRLTFFDPACGCGNFLILAYRELRRLEMEAIDRRSKLSGLNDGDELIRTTRLSVNQFYGIEIEEWPALIAEVGMWLMDHQMNNELFARLGAAAATIPLKNSPTIRHANALQLDWSSVLPPERCSYILGNPPFVGAKYQDKDQKRDLAQVWAGVRNAGLLDFVTGWHLKAADYMHDHPRCRAALVSTNSICQGEQVGVLWPELHRRGVKIDVAHRTFPWESEARGKAHVHVVIVGFGIGDREGPKAIHDYGPKGEPLGRAVVANISPYLTAGSDHTVKNRSKPLSDVPSMSFGNQPIDGGHLLMTDEERAELLAEEPNADALVRPYVGSREFINDESRWCLWLRDFSPAALRQMPSVMNRVAKVQTFRESSKRKATRELASVPTQFAFVSHKESAYLFVPSVSSERRPFIPIGFLPASTIASNLGLIVPDATRYHFGVLHSAMHMAWVRQVCGRLKSDYRYSARLVYNNFPWPTGASPAKRAAVEAAADAVLAARAQHPDATLADLYDPLTMPGNLARAHAKLDAAVDLCYRPQKFPDERRRFEHLFALHEKQANPLTS
jgi:hypothetical protein